MKHVFVYGTLLFSEILEGLTGDTSETREAKLSDYRRCSVKGADYPAIISQKGAFTEGKIVLNVDDYSFEMLRFFEGKEYLCIEVQVEAESENFNAWVFVWNDSVERLNDTDWDMSSFKRDTLSDYVQFVVPETHKEFKRLFS